MSAGQAAASSASAIVPLWDAVRIVCIGRLMSSVEHLLSRREFGRGGLLNYEPLRKLRYKARTSAGRGAESLVDEALLRQVGPLSGLDAALSIVLEVRPSLWPAALVAAVTQYLIMRRDMFSIEGADQMTLIVLLACGLGELSAGAGALAAVSFLVATTALAYFVAAIYKAAARPWVSGEALVTIVTTTAYGHPVLRGPALRHRRLVTAASLAVLLWESAFAVSVVAPQVVMLAVLAIGVSFHLACGLVMGLNRFLWAFTATYPAVIYLHGQVAGRQVVPWAVLLGVLWTVLRCSGPSVSHRWRDAAAERSSCSVRSPAPTALSGLGSSGTNPSGMVASGSSREPWNPADRWPSWTIC
jgi:hypothetical protein